MFAAHSVHVRHVLQRRNGSRRDGNLFNTIDLHVTAGLPNTYAAYLRTQLAGSEQAVLPTAPYSASPNAPIAGRADRVGGGFVGRPVVQADAYMAASV